MTRPLSWMIRIFAVVAFLPAAAGAETYDECKKICDTASTDAYKKCKKSDDKAYDKDYAICKSKAKGDRVKLDQCEQAHDLVCQKYQQSVWDKCMKDRKCDDKKKGATINSAAPTNTTNRTLSPKNTNSTISPTAPANSQPKQP